MRPFQNCVPHLFSPPCKGTEKTRTYRFREKASLSGCWQETFPHFLKLQPEISLDSCCNYCSCSRNSKAMPIPNTLIPFYPCKKCV